MQSECWAMDEKGGGGRGEWSIFWLYSFTIYAIAGEYDIYSIQFPGVVHTGSGRPIKSCKKELSSFPD